MFEANFEIKKGKEIEKLLRIIGADLCFVHFPERADLEFRL